MLGGQTALLEREQAQGQNSGSDFLSKELGQSEKAGVSPLCFLTEHKEEKVFNLKMGF